MSENLSDTLRDVTPSLNDGRYTVLENLREGRLYLAEKAGKRFILKTAADAKGLDLLKREYALSIGLSHPGLAYVFTWEEDSPVGPCIVQEWVDGPSLGQWLAGKPSLKERRRVFDELLAAVGYLHSKDIVHNDLKPDNILVSRSGGALKIIDLGFADSGACVQKGLGGTRGYASPELLSGAPADARSDIWSVGRLMQDLFPGRYGRFARRCLRKNPARRYPSIPALEAAWRRRNLPWKIALAVVVIGLILLPQLRDLKKTDALSEAKAQVEAAYARDIPAFREALQDARTRQEVTDAWLSFLESEREVNFDIPDAAPEEIRPALRDYILSRNNEILPELSEALNERMREVTEQKN